MHLQISITSRLELVCGNLTARQIFEMGLLDEASIQILEPCLWGSEVCTLERNPTGSSVI